MAKVNTNAWFISVGGTTLTARLIDINIKQVVGDTENTAGGSTTYIDRAETLSDTTVDMTFQYDDSTELTDIQLFTGKQTVIYGPQGSTGGLPKHDQSFILGGPELKQAVGKDNMVFSVSGKGAGVPTTDMYAGGTW